MHADPTYILTQHQVYLTLQVLQHYSEHKVIFVCLGLPVNSVLTLLLPIPPTADVDFNTTGFPQIVTIPAGQTSVQFTVTVIDELIVERDELFQLSFTYSGSQPGIIVRSGFDQANITIRNDDGMFMFSSVY